MLRGAEKLVPAEYWCPYGTNIQLFSPDIALMNIYAQVTMRTRRGLLLYKFYGISALWFSREHCWMALLPFWLSTDDNWRWVLKYTHKIGSLDQKFKNESFQTDFPSVLYLEELITRFFGGIRPTGYAWIGRFRTGMSHTTYTILQHFSVWWPQIKRNEVMFCFYTKYYGKGIDSNSQLEWFIIFLWNTW